ncbi:MAG: YbaY family lipoprotein [Sphaerochaetaceae bacterium]|nr:YbaY family lipoprotein [Sphaerochaetaceae bacterium]
MKKTLIYALFLLLTLCSCSTLVTGSVERFSLKVEETVPTNVGMITGSISFGAGFYFPTSSDILDISLLKTDADTGLMTEISHMRYRNFQKFPVPYSVRYDQADLQEGDSCSLIVTLSVDNEVTAQGIARLKLSGTKTDNVNIVLVAL